MNEYFLPPVRLDSPPLDAHALSQQIDWGLRERAMPEIWKRSAGEGDNSIRNVAGLRTFIQQHADDRGELGKDNRFGFGVPRADELVRDPECLRSPKSSLRNGVATLARAWIFQSTPRDQRSMISTLLL